MSLGLADAAVQLRRLEAIVGAGAMLELDWRGLTRPAWHERSRLIAKLLVKLYEDKILCEYLLRNGQLPECNKVMQG